MPRSMVEITLGKKFVNNQVVRFIFSAGSGFLVDIGVFYLLYDNLFLKKSYRVFSFSVTNYMLSLAISFALGVIVNFLITRYLVFSESKTPPSQQFLRFAGVAVIGFFANLGVITILIKVFSMYPPVARIVAALSLFFASYFVHKLFSFSLSLRHQSHGNRKKEISTN